MSDHVKSLLRRGRAGYRRLLGGDDAGTAASAGAATSPGRRTTSRVAAAAPATAPLLARVDQLQARVRELEAALAGRADDVEAVAGPIFVGGTGRSGTWALGRLLGAHPDIATISTEVRFHAAAGGFRKVLNGRETAADYAARVARDMFEWRGPNGGVRGISLVASRECLDEAAAALAALAPHDPAAGLRAYMHALLDPFATQRGARTWVETTPPNAFVPEVLHEVFPTGKVIHSVRDGRDVAASVLRMPWGPDTFDEGLQWWATRVRQADRGARAADPLRLHVVRLEELVHVARERELERMLDVLGIRRRDELRAHFAEHMTTERAHVGRWRSDTDPARAGEIDRAYRALYDELAAEGVQCLPLHPDAVDDLRQPA